MLRTTTGYEGRWDATNPQGLLYLNGYMTQGLDTNHTYAFLEADTEYVAHNYFYIGLIDTTVACNMTVLEFDGKQVTVPVSNFEIVTLKFI